MQQDVKLLFNLLNGLTKTYNTMKNDLLTSLLYIDKRVKEEKIFEIRPDKSFTIPDDEHFDKVGNEIAAELNGRYENRQLHIFNDIGEYTINLESSQPETFIKALKAPLPQSNKFTKSMPKIFELNPKTWYGIACQFESAEEVLTGIEYTTVDDNLHEAHRHLIKLQEEQPDNVKAIAKLTAMVKMWEEHVAAWKGIYYTASRIDYVALAKTKKEQ